VEHVDRADIVRCVRTITASSDSGKVVEYACVISTFAFDNERVIAASASGRLRTQAMFTAAPPVEAFWEVAWSLPILKASPPSPKNQPLLGTPPTPTGTRKSRHSKRSMPQSGRTAPEAAVKRMDLGP
jgi:hypothetical protein